LTIVLAALATVSGVASLCLGGWALWWYTRHPHFLPAQEVFAAIWLSGVCLAAMVAMILVRN
jgi:steroid 5-alpha reductase family enzyme